jgi:hypothetical protein
MVHTTASEGTIVLGGLYSKCVLGRRHTSCGRGQCSYVRPNARISRSVIYGLMDLKNEASYAMERADQGLERCICV